MTFKATLELDSKSYKLKNVNFSLHQDVDFRNGKPASEVTPGSINIDMDLTGENTQTLWDWSADSHLKKNGSIKFYKQDDGESSMVELKFEDGFCTNFSASMNEGSSSMSADLVIHARKVEIGGSPVIAHGK